VSDPSRAAAGRASALVALSACGFAAIAIFVTFARREGAPLLSILSWRYIIATLVLGGIALQARALRFDRPAWRVLGFAGFGQAVIAVLTLIALNYIPAATLSFLFYTYPGWVAVIARFRHSEPLTPLRLLALGLSLAGIFVMVGAPGTAALHPAGVTLALLGAFLYAAYVPMVNALQRGLPEIATATYMSMGAGVLLVAAAAVRGELTANFTPVAWRAILGLSLLSTVAAFLLFLRGLRALGAVRTAIISTVEPFFTAVLGAWLLGQPLTSTTLIGGTLIAAAVILLQLQPANGPGPRVEGA
jgi:drug/metabolite transporter (DMT)-like permease